MKVCPRCAEHVRDEARQCPHCGQSVATKGAPVRAVVIFGIILFVGLLYLVGSP